MAHIVGLIALYDGISELQMRALSEAGLEVNAAQLDCECRACGRDWAGVALSGSDRESLECPFCEALDSKAEEVEEDEDDEALPFDASLN